VEALQGLLEQDPSIPLTLDLQTTNLRFTLKGGEVQRIPVTLSAAQKQRFTSGTWDSMATLLDNLSAIEARAKKIPYIQGFIP
jgi:hypothetical protein